MLLRFVFLLLCEPPRQRLSVEGSEWEKEDEDVVQCSHSVALTNPGDQTAGETDGEERDSDHDPGVVVKRPHDVCRRGKFSWRFGNPVHGIHSNPVRVVHQGLSLSSVADDGNSQVCLSITNLGGRLTTMNDETPTSYSAYDSIESSILVLTSPVSAFIYPVDGEIVLVHIAFYGHPLNGVCVDFVIFKIKIKSFTIIRNSNLMIIFCTNFFMSLLFNHSQG